MSASEAISYRLHLLLCIQRAQAEGTPCFAAALIKLYEQAFGKATPSS